MNILILPPEVCEMRADPHERNASIFTFPFEGGKTTIRIAVNDEQSGADLIITNMTTLPDSMKRKGYGSKALTELLKWVILNGLQDIQAVQVQRESEAFWIKNGFRKIGNITNDFQYKPITSPTS